MDNQFLTFDEAVLFLKTNASTLYKWLQSGKVPGHKLGRRWRFVKEELELYLSGKGQSDDTRKEAGILAKFLADRSGLAANSDTSPEQLLLNLVRDALQCQASSLHFVLSDGRYQILYRMDHRMQKITTVHEDLFDRIHEAFIETSYPLQDEHARGAYLETDNAQKPAQIHYQKIDTLNGNHVTLKLIDTDIALFPIEQFAPDPAIAGKFRHWLETPCDIIIVSGMVGNGMTTIVCSFLNYLKNQGKNVFLLQDYNGFRLPDIGQVEITSDDAAGFDYSLKQIMASEADGIGITLSPASLLEPELFRAAYRAAAKGHLVILQFNAVSNEAVVDKIKKHAPDMLENELKIGLSHQRLVPVANNKRRAEFTLLELNQ